MLHRPVRVSAILFGLGVAFAAAGQSTPNVHTASPQTDPGVYSGRVKVEYPTLYRTRDRSADPRRVERVHGYLLEASPVHAITRTRARPASLDKLPEHVALARTDLLIATYESGVTYAWAAVAAEITSDARYRDYTTSA